MVSSEDYETTNYKQAVHLLAIMQQIAPTKGKMQRIFAAGNILKAIAECPDISRVNVEQILDLFTNAFTPAKWTPFEHFPKLIQRFNWESKWGIKPEVLLEFGDKVDDYQHKNGMYQPVRGIQPSVTIWLGGTIVDNWIEMVNWLIGSMRDADIKIHVEDRIKSETLGFFGSGPHESDVILEPSIIHLDDNDPGRFEGDHHFRIYPARFDLIALLALNPELIPLMGSKLPKTIAMGGFLTDDNSVPCVSREGNTLIIDSVRNLK